LGHKPVHSSCFIYGSIFIFINPIKLNNQTSMKNNFKFYALSVATLISIVAFAQKSPPATVQGKGGAAAITIKYSQPSAKGRKIMGELVPYGKVWRTGADNSTSIVLDKAVKLEGQDLAAGTYAIFTIPGETEWTIIINKTIAWGHYSYKEADDVLRVKVKPSKTESFVETFNISIANDQVIMKWENTQVAFGIKG
jgi:Protein of unknown function (DUF2911)